MIILTKKQAEILQYIALGYPNKAIAGLVGNSIKTVEKHRANIYRRLRINNAFHLMMIAIYHGLVDKQLMIKHFPVPIDKIVVSNQRPGAKRINTTTTNGNNEVTSV